MVVMKLNKQGFDLLARLEGLKLKSYLCPAGKWTIGLGNTFYEDGRKVGKGEVVSKERAIELFNFISKKYEKAINESVKVKITQPQFNALFCFAYNVGITGFKNSTLLRKINANADRSTIEKSFMMWKGKPNEKGIPILKSRRDQEIKEYFINE